MKLLKTFLFIGSAVFLSASEKDFLENPPYAYNGISIGRTAETERTPDGEGAFEVSVRYGSADLAWPSQLRNNIPAEKSAEWSAENSNSGRRGLPDAPCGWD